MVILHLLKKMVEHVIRLTLHVQEIHVGLNIIIMMFLQLYIIQYFRAVVPERSIDKYS